MSPTPQPHRGSPATGGMRVLVVDDERPALDELAFLLGRDDRVADVITCQSATEALKVLHAHEVDAVDAVFVDIAMPGLTGLELAEVLSRYAVAPQVVFVTAHAEHAVSAFALNAVDYLLKPIDERRLHEAVRRLAGGGSPADPDDETIPVELGGVIRFVARSRVRYVEAHGDYCRLHTDEGSALVRLTIGSLEERWRPAGFVRIHRSLLVCLRHVDEVRIDDARWTVLIAGQELQVSRRHTPALRELLRSYQQGSFGPGSHQLGER